MRIAVAGGTGVVGRFAVEAAASDGHEVVVLARSHGVDVRSRAGLAEALVGVDALIDATNAPAGAATDFFTEVATSLQVVADQVGVRHLVTLSIVGIDRVPENGYYAAKLRQEQITLAGPVPASVLRATQFHEFGPQMLLRSQRHGTATVPDMRVHSVAARSVGQALVERARGEALGLLPDVAGPEETDLLAEVEAFIERFGLALTVVATPATPSVAAGANLPAATARFVGPSFAEWLDTDDAARVAAPLRAPV